jgi:ABC-2 type transport system permease protein
MSAMDAGKTRRRPGFVLATGLMFRLFFATLWRGRKTWAVLAMCGLCLVLTVTARVPGSHREPFYALLLSQMIFGFLAQIAALLYGIAVVREEVDNQTLTYLLVRPIRRVTIIAGRWLAALVMVVGLMVAISAVVHGVAAPGIGAETPSGLAVVGAAALGGAYYTTAFMAIAVLFRRAFLIGLGYLLFWEFALPLVPSGAATLSLKYHLLNLVGLANSGFELPIIAAPSVPVSESVAVLVTATLVLGLLALWVFPRREYLTVRA